MGNNFSSKTLDTGVFRTDLAGSDTRIAVSMTRGEVGDKVQMGKLGILLVNVLVP